MKKKSILVLSLLIVMSATLAVPAFACPQEKKLVIDVTYGIINEEDPGVCSWYWALDNRVVHLRVWQLPGDANSPYNYLAEETSFGSFYVPKGAPQVIDWLTLQVRSGYGVMKTYDSWIIRYGQLNPTHFANGHPLKTKGYLGTVNYGGTVADILTGLHNNMNGNPGYWSWKDHYFGEYPPVYADNQKSVWTYRLCGDPNALARYMETGYYKYPITGNIIT